MSQRFYRPDFYQGLWGWNHDVVEGVDVVSGERPESSVLGAGLNFSCLDNRVLFGSVFCRPGAEVDADRFVWELGELVPGGLTIEEWLLADPDNPDRPIGYEGTTDPFRAQRYPAGTEVMGPTMRDIFPAPDFAQVSVVLDATNWWGYHNACYVDPGSNPQGCGTYRFEQPEVVINAFGGPRVGVSAGIVLGSLAGEDPDPTTPGILTYVDPDHPALTVDPPLSSSFAIQGFVPQMGGLLRPPETTYVPDPLSSDVNNTAIKELWPWSDVVNRQISIEFGGVDDQFWRIAWGLTTSDAGTVSVGVRPFWRINPEIETPGQLHIGPMVSHHRQVRGGRTGHRGGNAN